MVVAHHIFPLKKLQVARKFYVNKKTFLWKNNRRQAVITSCDFRIVPANLLKKGFLGVSFSLRELSVGKHGLPTFLSLKKTYTAS